MIRMTHVAGSILKVLGEYQKLTPMTDVPIDVDRLKLVIQEIGTIKTIAWHAVDAEVTNFLGHVKFYYPVPKHIRTIEEPTTAVIRYGANLNFCWRRFLVAKEMCHCLIDCEEDRVTELIALKTLAEGLASNASTDLIGNGPLATERVAEIMALEILYPYELRRTQVDDLKKGRITANGLALRYRIPLEFAEIGMYDHYLEFIKGLRGDDLLSIE